MRGECESPGSMLSVVASTVGSVVIRRGRSIGSSMRSVALSFNHSVTRYFFVLGHLTLVLLPSAVDETP